MKPALLDTDTFSEILKGRDWNVRRNADDYLNGFGTLMISVITVLEIVKGLARNQPTWRDHSFLEGIRKSEVLDLDQGAAEISGQIIADLERIGQTIGWADPLIAAIAIHHGLTLVTGNTKHFQRIAELGYPLALANWRDDPATLS